MRIVLLVLGFLLLAAPPASAHAGGLRPSDRVARVVAVEPPLPGVAVDMVNHGTQIEVRNHGTGAVTVADRVVEIGAVVRFADERTTRVAWEMAIGPSVIKGVAEPAPGPNPLWWAVIPALTLGGWLLGRSRALLAIGVVVVASAHVWHAIGSTLVVVGQSFVPLLISASGVGLVCWPLAAVAVVTAVRRRPATAFVAAIVGAMLVVAGIPDLDSFRFAYLPFAGPADLDRLLVALTLGGGLGLAVGGFARMRRETSS
ncbi:hypothetical protein GCM10022243_25930 [Saccharothrix violaceirubra]|uniref:Uncharacterized protein n=1 Tax=Saccharothrix violaceirubra TaxID=413306 RepID=A0A7W7T604_9PSEU|nr:hypothetical protein [Saccharothrix violaceirubra]MBB4967214.1 hypothetical protein [Saccharothrix violaceirubra]